MNVNVNDEFRFKSTNGIKYDIKIVNISEYRPEDQKYAADVCDQYGNYAKDVVFFGDDFLLDNQSRLKKIKNGVKEQEK